MKAYQIEYNDMGSVVVIAENYNIAESTFLLSGYGGDKPTIKSISIIPSTGAVLISK